MASVNDPLAFAKLIPGFDFIQQFAQAATGKGASTHFSDWIAPTFNIEELGKRIEDLKAVQFWLEQNVQTIRATTQALEVQKMTLATLQGMNLNLADVAQAFAVPTPAAPASDAAPSAPEQPAAPQAGPDAAPQSASSAPQKAAPGIPDPLQWWGALTEQFQTIAANTLREAASAVPLVPTGDDRSAARKSARKPAARKPATRSAAGSGKSAGRATSRKPAARRSAG